MPCRSEPCRSEPCPPSTPPCTPSARHTHTQPELKAALRDGGAAIPYLRTPPPARDSTPPPSIFALALALQHSPWDPPSTAPRPQLGTFLPRAPPDPAPPPSLPTRAPHSRFSRGFGVFSTYCTGPRALSPLCPPSSCCSTSCQAVDGGLWVNPRAGSTLQPPPTPSPSHLRRRSGRSPRAQPCSSPRAQMCVAAAPAAVCRSLC